MARYNTIVDTVLEAHSIQGNVRACRKWEIYNNTFVQKTRDLFSAVFLRGGTGVVFNNTITGTFNSSNLLIDNVRTFQAMDTADGATVPHPGTGTLSPTAGRVWTRLAAAAIAPFDGTPPPYPKQTWVLAYFWSNTVNGGTQELG